MGHCRICSDDQEWLRQAQRPAEVRADGDQRLRLVDLFAGCGGLSFGLVESARRQRVSAEVVLAVELDRQALRVFQRNLPTVDAREQGVESLFDGGLGRNLTLSERRLAKAVGNVDLLVGGPPCQGNSDLNNKTRRRDPRNRLYARMARAAEVLEPACVLMGNHARVKQRPPAA